jgi:RNA polymerase subunit RPABC4/transcription elongation factor Spt4
MDQIFESIGDAIGSIFDNPVIQFGLQVIAAYWVILWLAAAYWAFRDTQLRTENPIAPYLAATGIIVSTPLLFPLAVFAYRIVRPQERIGEVYERNLAEEALLNEIEAVRHCPGCERRVDLEWIICPTCRTRLNRVCPNCGRLVGLEWTLCAWCGKDFERRELIATVSPVPQVSGPVLEALPEPSAAAAEEPIPKEAIRTTLRRRGRSAAAGSSPAIDPLPER